MRRHAKSAIAVPLLVLLLASSVGSGQAGVLPVNTTAVNAAATGNLTDVRYRRGAPVAAGIAFGLLGAAIASQYYAYPPYYYGGYPAYVPYPPPVYYYPYPYYGPYVGRPYVVYHAYPRYRHYGVRHYRHYGVRHYRPRHKVRR
jgi:hypothetical protein